MSDYEKSQKWQNNLNHQSYNHLGLSVFELKNSVLAITQKSQK